MLRLVRILTHEAQSVVYSIDLGLKRLCRSKRRPSSNRCSLGLNDTANTLKYSTSALIQWIYPRTSTESNLYNYVLV